jgi:hypothetical protein
MHTLRELQAVKDRLGGFTFLDFTGYDLQTAHRHLGKHVRPQVHKILSQRLDRLNPTKFSLLLKQAQSCAELLTDKLADLRWDSVIHRALQEYVDCLTAWGDGAGLRNFDHPALADHIPHCTLDLALFLQHDSSGCQTGMYRQADGSVILWHTEEDIEFDDGSGFDQLRLAAFNVGDENDPVSMHAFIYPDLLPGPAFGWRSDGYAQAVDTLHTREIPFLKGGMLANIATWITLRLGPGYDTARVIESLGPYFDGYALNVVSVQGGEVRAEKYEFAENHILPNFLGEQTGNYLFQVNIFSQDEPDWVKQVEELPASDHKLYIQRMKYTQEAIHNKDFLAGEAVDMCFFLKLISSRSGVKWPYANTDMKAYFILHQNTQETEIWLGHGPALPGDEFSIIKVPLD